MTKTTNYEISKKLSKAGFGKGSAFAYFKSKCGGGDIFYVFEGIKGGYEAEFFSYDLETILDALPKEIEFRGKEYCFWMQWSGSSDCYIMGYVHGNLRATELEVWREDDENKSLADIAGEMWLILKKKGLI